MEVEDGLFFLGFWTRETTRTWDSTWMWGLAWNIEGLKNGRMEEQQDVISASRNVAERPVNRRETGLLVLPLLFVTLNKPP